MSRATVTASPAQFSSWNEARAELMVEAKKPLKAQLAGELAVAADEDERKAIKAEYEARERAFEHELDHTPRELSMALTINCARLPCPFRPHCFALTHPHPPSLLRQFLVEVERRPRSW